MIIEIKGTGSHNKGSEMMLLTILEQLKDKNLKFTVAPYKGSCEYSFYSKLGLYPKSWIRFKGFQIGKLGKFIPKRIRDLFGIIIDEEVDVILDASGFAYSSQWGDSPAKVMAEQSKHWKQSGKKIILLPQAFGPFKTENIKRSIKKIIENSTLIYARDNFSYQELLKIKNDKKKIKLYPDFTVLLKGILPSDVDPKLHQVCIVPNQRMKDKRDDSDNYEEFFSKIISKLQAHKLSPFFLIHGGAEDRTLAEKINLLLDVKIEIISEENPYFIKGIIENSIGLIGSRFHSLASGLYSGVPTLGTGWSHKYLYLFEEFNFNEGLIELKLDNEELDEKLDLIISNEKREVIKQKLLENKKEIETKTLEMFEDIRKEIGLR